jgi:hypothetical protein
MNHTFCKHLRTKKMYIDATPGEALADNEGGEASTCHYWCNRTQTVAGPDDQQVHKTTCNPARSCFEE